MANIIVGRFDPISNLSLQRALNITCIKSSRGVSFFPARHFRSYLFGGQTTSYEHTNYVGNNRKLDLALD